MKKILIYAGTTEGRILSDKLKSAGIHHTVCVTSEYGTQVLKDSSYCEIHMEKMNAQRMKEFISENGFDLIVDATHPYAYEASKNIKEATEKAAVKMLRLRRDTSVSDDYEGLRFFASNEECAEVLKQCDGNILLTTGSKELPLYCKDPALKERLYVRIIPNEESLRICQDYGIPGKNIIAAQGPFSSEFNEAMIEQYQIACLVSKQSGAAGGFSDKLSAAKKKGISFYVIGCEEKEEGLTLSEVLQSIGVEDVINPDEQVPTVLLCGIGPGEERLLTKEVRSAIKEADLIFGAERMLAVCKDSGAEKLPFYTSKDILPLIKERLNGPDKAVSKIVILFSGDSGFFSGARGLKENLEKEISEGGMKADVQILPGISSVSYFASALGVNYEDAALLSIHGKSIPNLARVLSRNKKTFLLLSGKKDVNALGNILSDAGLSDADIVLGIRLSYEDEKILKLSAEECKSLDVDGPITAYIHLSNTKRQVLTPGLGDDEFIRERVPMTKEEVRALSLCKLRLLKDSILYDIGGGTGSVSVEAARLSDEIRVFSIEKKEVACELIRKNQKKFGVENIEVIHATAPNGIRDLPVGTHAFVGGSSGNLKSIIETLYAVNPCMRVVINAISIETVGELKEILKLDYVKNTDLVQVQISHAKNVSEYHLMTADNPVWICSFDFDGGKE